MPNPPDGLREYTPRSESGAPPVTLGMGGATQHARRAPAAEVAGHPDRAGAFADAPAPWWVLLAGLPAPERDALVGSARRRTYRRGQTLMIEGDRPDGFHLVEVGHVAVQRTRPDGVTGTLAVLGPGALVGELGIISPAPRNATVVALDRVETLKLLASDLDELRRSHPSIDRFLVGVLTAEVRRLSGLLIEAHYADAETRVRHRLADLIRLFGAADGVDGPVEIPLTQEELAQLAGTTRATTNRVLRAAAARGELRLGRSALTVVAEGVGTT
ncbi:MAG: Crp/Fnr family transcriptional regulator [Desertimonas sp.]